MTKAFSHRNTSLMIFLGLLGTFWGLLATIRSIGEVIGNLSVGSDPVAMFEALKAKLDAPLGGMATSASVKVWPYSPRTISRLDSPIPRNQLARR